jgi:hypothetical protein
MNSKSLTLSAQLELQVQFLNFRRKQPKETRKIIEGSLAVPPSVEDQTKWETIKGNEKDCCGKPNDASKQ